MLLISDRQSQQLRESKVDNMKGKNTLSHITMDKNRQRAIIQLFKKPI